MRLHDLRHSFASGALSLGEGLPMIGKLLGHSQVQTTARDAHLADDPVKAAAGKVSDDVGAAMMGGGNRVTAHDTFKRDQNRSNWVAAEKRDSKKIKNTYSRLKWRAVSTIWKTQANHCLHGPKGAFMSFNTFSQSQHSANKGKSDDKAAGVPAAGKPAAQPPEKEGEVTSEQKPK